MRYHSHSENNIYKKDKTTIIGRNVAYNEPSFRSSFSLLVEKPSIHLLPLWKAAWRLLQKNRIFIWSSNSISWYVSLKHKNIPDINIYMFITVLNIIARRNRWLDKEAIVYIQNHYTAVRKMKSCSFQECRYVVLKGILLSKVN